MSYAGRFTQKVRHVDIEDEGETQRFFIKKPRGAEMLDRLDQDMSKGAMSRDMLNKTIVNEDGSALTPEDFAAILSMESSAFVKLSEAVGIIMQGKKPNGEAKKD